MSVLEIVVAGGVLVAVVVITGGVEVACGELVEPVVTDDEVACPELVEGDVIITGMVVVPTLWITDGGVLDALLSGVEVAICPSVCTRK